MAVHIATVVYLWTCILIISVVFANSVKDIHSPCYGCQLFNILQRDQAPKSRKKDKNGCDVPCYCPVKEMNCNEGISVVKDGCGCCFQCARQHGDMCSFKNKCDASKGLFCERKSKNSHEGVCKALSPKPCSVNGLKYKDGEQFQLGCSKLCTCQNGIYGCESLCPQEYRAPSEAHCPSPKLMSVPGQCCKEWTCQPENIESGIVARHAGYGTYNDDQGGNVEHQEQCPTNTTEWTPCSTTCDTGISIRFSRENCRVVQETRLCMLRPCGEVVKTMGREKCTPTTRSKKRHRIVFQDCRSVKEYTLKFCTSCKRHRCCYPRKTKTRSVEFKCNGDRRDYKQFMWIKSCRCDRECYKEDAEKTTKEYWRRDMAH